MIFSWIGVRITNIYDSHLAYGGLCEDEEGEGDGDFEQETESDLESEVESEPPKKITKKSMFETFIFAINKVTYKYFLSMKSEFANLSSRI